ncbi:MAG: hemerythrin cation-binding protein [Myxococcaceae bacterium]|nr:hemerythrin cation-binding protein [Myxococcaceae bacterium]
MTSNQQPTESFEQLCRHERQLLDEILADVEFLSLRESYLQAASRFGELRHLLEEHILTEERLVLPLFIERTGDPHQLADRIRNEHNALADLVELVAAAISRWDRTAFIDRVADLRAALKVHHEDEEAQLHPGVADVLKTAADWRLLCLTAGLLR